jgi:hypothetical protein
LLDCRKPRRLFPDRRHNDNAYLRNRFIEGYALQKSRDPYALAQSRALDDCFDLSALRPVSD